LLITACASAFSAGRMQNGSVCHCAPQTSATCSDCTSGTALGITVVMSPLTSTCKLTSGGAGPPNPCRPPQPAAQVTATASAALAGFTAATLSR
jgi:hypothetical protein